MSRPLLLRATGLTKIYGRQTVLEGVSIELRERDVVTVIGPSGAGKTTLLRSLCLLEHLDSGVIEWPQIDLTWGPSGSRLPSRAAKSDPLRRYVGVVFQNLNLWDHRTVWDNLTLAPRVASGEQQHIIESRAKELCGRLGIDALTRAWAWQLSGGQRQRVAIARALMTQPVVLMLDEVTSALDPVLTVEVMNLVKDLQTKMTMLLVTHHIEFAASVSQRLIFLSHGRVAQEATPDDMLRSPANEEVAEFLSVLRRMR